MGARVRVKVVEDEIFHFTLTSDSDPEAGCRLLVERET